jgi:oligoendopeptidase F
MGLIVSSMDWNLTSYFTEFGSLEFTAFKDKIVSDTDALRVELDRLAHAETDIVDGLATALNTLENLGTRVSHLSSYISCLVAADAANETYAAEEAALSTTSAVMSKLHNQVLNLIGGLSTDDRRLLVDHPTLKGCAYALSRMETQSQRRMSAAEEELAADLGIHGVAAWSRLYFSAVSNMSFSYEDPETGPQTAPLSQLNSLLASANRERRLAANEGSAKALQGNQHLFAAALNAIAGTRLELNRRRGIPHFLEPGLFQSGIGKASLEALMAAIESRVDFAREVFRFRTATMGIEKPGWVDLRASLPIDGSTPTWVEGVSLISDAFQRTYPTLGDFFDQMIEKEWIDHSPRSSKRPGGFCTNSALTGESRIFMTYKDTLNDVLTLAHEAGHAWHARLLKDTRLMAGRYPMTLAETASTFAERLLTQGVLSNPSIDQKTHLVLLDAEVEHMLAFLLDLPIRFRFEEAVYRERAHGTLSPSRFCHLMASTQQRFFGDTFSEESPDPWFWASKMHFYFDKIEFYNYPYVFGYLLSQAFVDAIHQDASEGFAAYERFLKCSGSLSCEAVVKETLGLDISEDIFWKRQIDGLCANFAHYQSLLQAQSPF